MSQVGKYYHLKWLYELGYWQTHTLTALLAPDEFACPPLTNLMPLILPLEMEHMKGQLVTTIQSLWRSKKWSVTCVNFQAWNGCITKATVRPSQKEIKLVSSRNQRLAGLAYEVKHLAFTKVVIFLLAHERLSKISKHLPFILLPNSILNMSYSVWLFCTHEFFYLLNWRKQEIFKIGYIMVFLQKQTFTKPFFWIDPEQSCPNYISYVIYAVPVLHRSTGLPFDPGLSVCSLDVLLVHAWLPPKDQKQAH